ncbi:EFR1 family ferrodoxin, partial [bacterium]|nr:EFR1 family ferrodoxin [bacterium]
QLMKQDSIEIADDAVGIVCPVYAVEMPMMVREFMSRAKIKTDYFFFVYTYGMGYAEAFAHARLAAEQAGLKLNYISAVQMVDNYLPVFEMQNQIDTLGAKNVEGQIAEVCRDIADRKERTVDITPATRERMDRYVKQLAIPILRKDTAKGYTVSDSCVRCGICAKVCPANNIIVKDKVVFLDRCEVCYACLHNCPQNAIHMASERSTVRFRNEHIALKDIIQANE